MDILEGLNPEQRAAVEHTDGPMLVVAGAGTGKTQVITRRIAHLLARGRAKPGEILALTFTEKAAREMQDRLYGLIGWESFQVPVMTFHAFGADLLSRYASHIGRSIRGGLLNDTQKTLLLQQHLSQIQLNYYGPQSDTFEFLEGIVSYIGTLQNANITADQYDNYVAELKINPGEIHPRDIDEQADLAALYRLYEDVKAKTGTFDYNDQLQLPLEILRQRSNLAQRLGQEYRYVLVDEYQDTNATQDELLRTFVGPGGNMFAVGDDDQAIYGFRGAEIGNILAFAERYKLQQPVVLVRNYRSGQAILDSAYRLIRHNDPERLEAKLGLNKQLIALHDKSTVSYRPYRTAIEEQQGVLEEIAGRIEAGESPGSIAVLAATHAPLKSLAKAMRSRGVPYALSTAVNIFEQPELIGLWYLLKWLCWQANEEAIGHVIMGPLIGWKANEYRRVLDYSRENFVTIEEALRQDGADQSEKLIAELDEWRKYAQELPVGQLVFKIIFESERADKWRGEASSNARLVRVFEDLQRFLEQMQDFESVSIDPTLASYSSLFPKPPALEVAEPAGDSDGVQLLTVHASKGLEFETVYLIGCTQRSWSGSRVSLRPVPDALQAKLDLPPEHEMRRLMYVAVTRARRTLQVSAACQTAGGNKQAISPFIGELFGEEVAKQMPPEVNADRIGKAMSQLQHFYPMQSAIAGAPRLPFEDAEGWLDLGVTSLGGYEYCPFEFYVEHVLGIKQPLGPQLAFGSVLHKVIENFYKGKLTGNDRPAVELHALLDELWTDKGYETKALAQADRKLAHDTLERFVGRPVNGSKVLGSEVPIRFEVPEAKLRLRGKIDAILETVAGIELRDFKTGRTKTEAEKLAKDAKNNFQLRSYALAFEVLKGQSPAHVTLDYIVTDTEGTAELSAAILRNHREKLKTLADRIRARDFAPNPSPMHVCAAIRFYGTGEQDALADDLLMGAN